MIKPQFLLLISILLLSCQYENQHSTVSSLKVNPQTSSLNEHEQAPTYQDEFSRIPSFNRLKSKIKSKKPLSIHVRIPLCDNEHQGIVPVPKKLGNGLDLDNNLYWGAKYGFKNHFKTYTNWKLILSEKNTSNTILERVVFKKKMSNETEIYIIADAYRGDAMKECLKDYLNSIAGNSDDHIKIKNKSLGIGSNADLIIFNGHNGLMDYHLDIVPSTDQISRETAVIGCLSHKYFKDHLLASKGYPLLMTTNLMAPEAYVVESVIESWIQLEDEKTIRKNTGIAYHTYQKCGINGATNLFTYGW
ncbi:MAG: hypothetical protein P1U56_19020 [Saprospiraceae bacterium]|nr:hypothetical protein [Saprospiraceae bacterium]